MKPINKVFGWGVILLFPFLSGSIFRGDCAYLDPCHGGDGSYGAHASRWAGRDSLDLVFADPEGRISHTRYHGRCGDIYEALFTVPGEPSLNDIQLFVSPDFEFNVVVGDNGTIVIYHEFVHTWTVIPSPTTHNLNGVGSSLDGSLLVAVGDAGAIVRSTDYGLTWELVNPPGQVDLIWVYINSYLEDYIQVSGHDGVYRTFNGGTTWEEITLGGAGLSKRTGSAHGFSINRLYHQDDNNAYVIADGGIIIKTIDDFFTTEFQDASTSENLEDIYFISPDSGFVIGENGTARLTVDGGTQWTEDPDITALLDGANMRGISAIDGEYAIVFGDSGLSITVARDSSIFTSVGSEQEIVTEYRLFQNYPNPFNPGTTIKYSVPRANHVTLKVYDIIGREVATLVDEKLNAGRHEKEFDATGLPSGVYFYKLTAGDFTATKKFVLLK